MYYEWEFVQGAMADWHYMECKSDGDFGRWIRLRLLARLAKAYLDFGKGDNGKVPTNHQATEVVRDWIARNVSGCRSWIESGR